MTDNYVAFKRKFDTCDPEDLRFHVSFDCIYFTVNKSLTVTVITIILSAVDWNNTFLSYLH